MRVSKAGRNEASEALVFEGIHIAEAACRMALKNRIVIDILGEGHDFVASTFVDEAREIMLSLAQEARDAAERVAAQRKRAWGQHSSPHGTHDYRDRDTRNLRRRGREYKKVAKELERRAADDAELLRIIEQARVAAWDDVAANIDSTLKVVGERPDLDPNYTKMRDARMQSVMMIDLTNLAARQRRRAETLELTTPSED